MLLVDCELVEEGKVNKLAIYNFSDMFAAGKAAEKGKLFWYNIKCDYDMLQLKTVISESRSGDTGVYMCLRLTKLEGDVQGLVVRQVSKLSKKYQMDCEFWGDGSDRRAYKFHLTDNPSWADLLLKHDSIVQASNDTKMKKCKDIPGGFCGEWKLSNSDKMVEFRKRYYRAYGAHSNDPFWRTNTELTFYSLICNRRRMIIKAYLWELPAGSRSQLQCLTLSMDGEYDISGHAVNMVASKTAGSDVPPEIDCDHNVGKDYTRYPLHLTRQLNEALAPKPIHSMLEPRPMGDDYREESQQTNSQHSVTEALFEQLNLPVLAANQLSRERTEEQENAAEISHFDSHKEHVAPDYEPRTNKIRQELYDAEYHHHNPSNNRAVVPVTNILRPDMIYQDPPWMQQSPYPALYLPPYRVDKRESDSQPGRKQEFRDDYEPNISNKLLRAINEQNKMLKTALDKLAAYIDKNSATTTQDWNYVRPYLKQDVHENVDKKELYAYYGDE